MFLVYADTDEEGNITEALAGPRVIPDKQYQYFFFLTSEIDLFDYKIINGKLTLKAE
jgi:hypothetical protein